MAAVPFRRALTAVLAAGILLAGAVNLSAAVLQAPALPSVVSLVGNVLPGLDRLLATALPAPSTPLQIGLGLAPADPAGEQALYESLYDPHSPLYHHFLTPDQIASRFGVSSQRLSSAVSWLQSQGLQVEQVGAGGTFIEAQGGVGQIDRLLGTTVRAYRSGGTSFLANDSAPRLPGALGVVSVMGLNTLQRFSTPHSTAQAGPAAAGTSLPAPGVYTGTYTPQDLWSLYNEPAGNQGQGQSMAIFGAGATDPVIANLRRFEDINHLPQIPVVVKRTGAGPWQDNTGEGEWDLDTQASTGMAPQVTQEQLYFGSSLSDAEVATMFSTWVSDPDAPRQASASFGECETGPLNFLVGNPLLSPLPNLGQQLGNNLEPVAEQILLQATLEGRTLFASTGDTGSSCPIAVLPIVGAGNGLLNQVLPLQNYPAASRYAVAVGGTVLYAKDKTMPRQRAQETAWAFGGGGSAFFIPEPSFQTNVKAVDRNCLVSDTLQLFVPGTLCRGLPDVAALSGDVTGNGYTVVGDMVPGTSGGTSLASPLWMGMWTRIQAAAADQAHGLGFADPILYAAGTSSHYAQDFNDITVGTNGLYSAARGWDYVSGWGTPNLTNLMQDIDGRTAPVSTATPLAVPAAPLATVCGTAFTSPTGNATDPVTNGQDPQLDLTGGSLNLSADGSTLHAVLSVADLTATVPGIGMAADWFMFWTSNGTTWFAQARVDRSGGVSYEDGRVRSGAGPAPKTNVDQGRFVPGSPGTIEIDVPVAHVGSPAVGTRLQYPYGMSSLQLATLAPTIDAAGGQDDVVLEPCGTIPGPPPAPAPPPASTPAPPALPLPLPITLPPLPIGIGGLTATAPKAPATPGLLPSILGLPSRLLGGTSAQAAQPSRATGLLPQVLRLLW